MKRLEAPLARICRVAGVSHVRQRLEQHHRRSDSVKARKKPGPVGAMCDDDPLVEIRQTIADSPFEGGCHRNITARLRRRGICTSPKRVLRLCREADLTVATQK